MGKFFDHIPERLQDFMQRSKMFFVATAPLQGGSVNVSPKANEGSFEIVDAHRVRYLDLTGSGNETISHLLQPGNGRITLMFCNIEQGAPNIVRLYGKGIVYERGTDEQFDQRWRERHGTDVPIGGRAIIDVAVHTCATSCGYSLPVYTFQRKRTVLDDFFAKYQGEDGPQLMAKYKGSGEMPSGAMTVYEDGQNGEARPGHVPESALEVYWAMCNNLSIDGLPGLKSVRSMLNEKEQQKLLEQRQQHDSLQPPSKSLGPLRGGKGATEQSTTQVVASQAKSFNVLQLSVAFTIGYAVSLAVMQVTRVL